MCQKKNLLLSKKKEQTQNCVYSKREFGFVNKRKREKIAFIQKKECCLLRRKKLVYERKKNGNKTFNEKKKENI